MRQASACFKQPNDSIRPTHRKAYTPAPRQSTLHNELSRVVHFPLADKQSRPWAIERAIDTPWSLKQSPNTRDGDYSTLVTILHLLRPLEVFNRVSSLQATDVQSTSSRRRFRAKLCLRLFKARLYRPPGVPVNIPGRLSVSYISSRDAPLEGLCIDMGRSNEWRNDS